MTTQLHECLIFEDLAQNNFKLINREDMTPEHILLVIKTVAKFHAVSIALKGNV